MLLRHHFATLLVFLSMPLLSSSNTDASSKADAKADLKAHNRTDANPLLTQSLLDEFSGGNLSSEWLNIGVGQAKVSATRLVVEYNPIQDLVQVISRKKCVPELNRC